jgi:cell division protein FtsN
MDALKSLADIQQKYPGVLQGRAADVREANLGAKGIWYRVVVGPPASRQTANTVCGELKARGFGGCWIAGY